MDNLDPDLAEAITLEALAEAGAGDRLYRLGDLRPFAHPRAGAVPVVSPARPPAFERAPDDAEFARRFAEAAPHLAGFDLKAHKLCLAGGAAAALLMRPAAGAAGHFHDLDLYLVGHGTRASARAAVEALRAHLAGAVSGAVAVYRSACSITFHFHFAAGRPPPVQVVTEFFSDAGAVLGSFDLGSCSALWDGEAAAVSARGRLAFERGVNALDLALRSAHYEARLERYFGRGYALALPNLSVAFMLSEGDKNSGNSLDALDTLGRRWRRLPCLEFAECEADTRRGEGAGLRTAALHKNRSGEFEGSDTCGSGYNPMQSSDPVDILMRNMVSRERHVREPERHPDDCCFAAAMLTPDLRVCDFNIAFDPALMLHVVLECLTPNRAKIANLRLLVACVGGTEAFGLRDWLAENPPRVVSRRRLADLCRRQAGWYAGWGGRLRIPVQLRDDDRAIASARSPIPPFCPVRPIAATDWYGAAFDVIGG